jgi:two-component system alkaline phosphatase synthesis response regulator PhoP
MCFKKILIAEDEPALLRSLIFTLKRFHFQATGVNDGIRALEYLTNSEQNSCDLFITDIQLPGISGFEVIDKVRSLGLQFPILVITAYGDQKVLTEIGNRKIEAYLTKPFSMDDLLQRIVKLMESKKN